MSKISPTSPRACAPSSASHLVVDVSSLWGWWVRQWGAPRSPQTVVLVLSLWLVCAGNLAFWHKLGQIPEVADPYGVLHLQLGALIFGGTAFFLSWFAWPRYMKPVWGVFMLVAAVAQHFMLEYGIFIDKSMVMNVVQTNLSEARDLLGWHLAANVLLVAGLPLWWLARVSITARSAWINVARTGLLFALSLGATLGGGLVMYRELAPLMRNNVELRFLINPLSSVVAGSTAVLKPLFKRSRPFVPISAGAALGASYAAQARPPLLVLVVGETARSDHFGLNGYPRNTTPELAARGVLSWRNVHSCGTNTLASVPCMFSHLAKAEYEGRHADYENLLDVLQSSGLAVLWIDNQSGCKGVCDRVTIASTSDSLQTPEGRALCQGGECLDEIMLRDLDERIALLPDDKSRNGVVVVMHQMGSHGPAYYRRSSPETKPFQPECTTHALADCKKDALINVYDNSIAYTDHFLAKTVDWLQQHKARHDVAMLYMSDHGESLGEYGLFLHGVPYALAPAVQKHVPMVLWTGSLTARSGVDPQCLSHGLDAALTHDNLYHTVLGMLDVTTSTYKRDLDAFMNCRAR